MKIEFYIASRILNNKHYKNRISKPIVKIGVIGIALGVAIMIVTLAVVTGFQKEIISKITGFSTHLQIGAYNINPSYEPSPITIPDGLLKKINQLPSVLNSQAYATKNGIIKTKTDNEGIVLKGVNEHYNWTFLKNYLTAGKLPSIEKQNVSKDILISKDIALKLNLTVGQKLLVYFITQKKESDSVSTDGDKQIGYEQRVKDFYVSGIYNTGFADFDKNLALVDLKQIQKLNYWDSSSVGGYEVILKNDNALDQSVDDLYNLLGYNYSITSIKQSQAALFSWLDMVDVNAIIIITLMVIVAGVNMITALLILILERTNMIGLLKALGQSNQSIRKIFLIVSLNLLGRGLIYGNVIGLTFCLIQSTFKPITLDASAYYVSFIPININLLHVLFINIGTTILCLLMMFLPTLLITKITPVKALKFD